MIGHALVLVTDPSGRVTLANGHFETVTGFRSSELVGQPVWQCLPTPESAVRMQEAFHRVVSGEALADDEGTWRRKEGAPVAIRWSYVNLRDSQDELHSVVIVGIDLSRSRIIQAELGESLDRYQAILDTAVDGIITINTRGQIETFNRAAERIFGYRASEVIGHNVSMLMPVPYREEHDRYLDNYLTTRRKKIIGIGREVKGMRKDGTVFPLDLAVGEVMLPNGRLFTGIIRDISDRKEAEQEARRRMNEFAHVMRLRSMGELASGLAHEVNQPLTAIISHAQACLRMMSDNRADTDLLRESLQQIAKQGQRAGEVIRRLRKYVEKGELEKSPSDLNTSIVEVLELLSHELQVHGIRVYLDAAQNLPVIPADRVQIEQVIVNLVRNAVEAMEATPEERRELHVATCPANHEGVHGVQIDVRDAGPGLEGDAPEKLFESFYTTKPQGLGQGLTICRRIVEAHGGQIWAEPADTGGAAFHVWLPANDPT
jgi:two-component system sensor kinase FixL